MDVNVRAFRVVQQAIGEAEPKTVSPSAQKGGLIGGRARAKKLTPKRRAEIAKRASAARWGKKVVS